MTDKPPNTALSCLFFLCLLENLLYLIRGKSGFKQGTQFSHNAFNNMALISGEIMAYTFNQHSTLLFLS